MNGQTKKSNDALGLAGRWIDVPPSPERPQSAIEFDQKGGAAKDMNFQQQRQYWDLRRAQYKSIGQSRKNGKRKDTGSKTTE